MPFEGKYNAGSITSGDGARVWVTDASGTWAAEKRGDVLQAYGRDLHGTLDGDGQLLWSNGDTWSRTVSWVPPPVAAPVPLTPEQLLTLYPPVQVQPVIVQSSNSVPVAMQSSPTAVTPDTGTGVPSWIWLVLLGGGGLWIASRVK